ncbi:hypothetical protein E0765_06435 [Sulfuricurvum sp. IAE1]|jgi:hypothetical protein|uniref:hypothetical protein n=1 Tax=Sulfuricurvum sp. IAE1 TaxID=2546102 RepID=UPI001052017B|nr:hypothetical protein [Sulfuricurvum sp. IAE1]MDX9966286.1 hypothetical protein [Sulfuricurvum sp.]TDA64349.1 hypothetical protein E0765_06435 [Sulfuricurvum sp. IAE1]
MNDEKLKIVLALLSGIIFSLVFILLAFVLPLKEDPNPKTLDTQLKKISEGIRAGKPPPPPNQ